MIEAFWRSLKHQWLYLNSLDSLARLRTLVEFYVEQHNTWMPHAAFHGQTPDEMYFGMAADLPAELAAARSHARAARLAANRGDVLRALPLSGSQPSRLGDSSMNLVLTLLRTPKYGISAHAAGLSIAGQSRCGGTGQQAALAKRHLAIL